MRVLGRGCSGEAVQVMVFLRGCLGEVFMVCLYVCLCKYVCTSARIRFYFSAHFYECDGFLPIARGHVDMPGDMPNIPNM